MNTNKSKNKEQQLLKQLISFGLNPADWSLRPVSMKKYFIEHKTDHDFLFIGETASNKDLTWNRIQLLSI